MENNIGARWSPIYNHSLQSQKHLSKARVWVVSSKNERYLQATAKSLVEHKPGLKCGDKWKP